MKWLNGRNYLDAFWTEIAVILSGSSFLFLIPFIYETVRSLKPEAFIKALLRKEDYPAIEELLHRATGEGFRTVIHEAGREIDRICFVKSLLRNTDDRIRKAKAISEIYLIAGRRALRKDEQDVFVIILDHLSALTQKCTEERLRREADIFNEVVYKLVDYSDEIEG